MDLDLGEVFADDVIIRYPAGIPPENLTHTYRDERLNSRGQRIGFEGVTELVGSLREEVEGWYEQEAGKPMDVFDLGELLVPTREKFWGDERFMEAFDILELPYEEREKTLIPWWNRIAASEADHQVTGNVVDIVLEPRHSYETQLMREGFKRPAVRNVTVGGILLTAPEDGRRYIAVGVRGGSNHPGLYHITAGACNVTEPFKTGMISVYDVFEKWDLKKEFGMGKDDVESATVQGRIYDHVHDMGPFYIFLVRTRHSRAQLYAKWASNKDPDKAEHGGVVFPEATPEAVNDFISAHYRGFLVNRVRGDHERYLMHPGALVLASFSGMTPGELKTLYRPGDW